MERDYLQDELVEIDLGVASVETQGGEPTGMEPVGLSFASALAE